MRKDIIRAKMIPPYCLEDYVIGRWQMELIKQKNHMVVLCARDGYGKTSFMTYCFEQMKEDAYCAWYLLDGKDNQIEQFVRYLIFAFEKATGRVFWEKEFQERAEKKRQTEMLLDIIYQFSYKLEQMDKPFVFFFDEVQNLVKDEVLVFFERLVEYTRDRVRFFFAGLEKLPSFLIRYLSCNKNIILLTENELRINQEQVFQILEKKGIEKRERMVKSLLKKAEGMPLLVIEEVYRLLLGEGKIEKRLDAKMEQSKREETTEILVKCLGNFYVEAKRPLIWRTKKCKELFAYLFSRCGKGVSNEKVVDVLWGNKTIESAKALFYTTLSYLRKALEEAGFSDMVYKMGELYYLKMEKITSDYDRLKQMIQRMDAEKITVEELEEFVSLYRGRYMEGIDGNWILEYYESVDSFYLKKIREYAKRLIAEQRYEEAVFLLKKGISVDSYSEAISELLIVCYAKMGEGRKAVEEYVRIKEALSLEFGMEVSTGLEAVYMEVTKR